MTLRAWHSVVSLENENQSQQLAVMSYRTIASRLHVPALGRTLRGWYARVRGLSSSEPQFFGDDLRLVDVALGERVSLIRLDMPHAEIEPLLERGILPGCDLCPIRRSPSGDPIIEVDGSVLVVRREVAACFCVQLAGQDARPS